MESVKRYSRRRALKIGVGMLGLGGLAACAPAAAPQVVEKEVTVIVEGTPQIVKETVVVQAPAAPVDVHWSYYVFYGDPEKTHSEFQAIADEVKALHPDTNVVLVPIVMEGMWEKLLTEFAAGGGPDVTVAWTTHIAPGAVRGMWVDLKPYMERDSFPDSPYWFPLDIEYGWQGGIYAVSMFQAVQAMYINKTLLAEAGLDFPDPEWTLDDFVEYCIALTDKEKGQWGTLNLEWIPWFLMGWIHAFGGSILNETYDKCALTSPEATAAVQWVHDLMFKYEACATPSALQGVDDPFIAGKAGTYVNGTYRTEAVREASVTNGFEWDFAHQPVHPETGIRSVYMGSSGWAILGNSPVREQAWNLVKYLGSVPGQRHVLKWGIPNHVELAESVEFLDMWKPQDVLVPISDAKCCAHDSYVTPDSNEWYNAAWNEMSAIWAGEATVEEGLANTCAALDEIFARRPDYYKAAASS